MSIEEYLEIRKKDWLEYKKKTNSTLSSEFVDIILKEYEQILIILDLQKQNK